MRTSPTSAKHSVADWRPHFRKRLVAQNRQYDFLDDLVASIVDPTAGVGGAAAPPMPAYKPASKPVASSRAPANQVDDGDDDEDEEEEY